MPTAPIPLASYLADLTMNFYDVGDVRATGDAVIQVIGGNGSVNIPVAQGVQGFSVYAGASVPTTSSPSGAVPGDQYLYGGTGASTPIIVATGDVLTKAGDSTWSVTGNIRGAKGIQGIPGQAGGPASGLPLGLTGATTATRWVGGTVSGPPTTGTFLTGDFATSQDGGRSVCTAGGSPGTWENTGGNTKWRHGWTGSQSVNGATGTITSLTASTGNGSVATYSAGNLLLNRAGRWSLRWYGYSDASNTAGRGSTIGLSWTSGAWSQAMGSGSLSDKRNTADTINYGGAGTLSQTVAWTGYVTAAEAAQPIYPQAYQQNVNNVGVTYSFALTAEYLGA